MAAASISAGTAAASCLLGDVQHEQQRLQREEGVARDGALLLRAEARISRIACSDSRDAWMRCEQVRLAPALPAVLAREPGEPLLDQLEVGEDRLGREALDLAQRFRRLAGGPREGAHHLAERLERAHRDERPAVDALPVPAAEIGEGDLRVGLLLRVVQRGERVDARVGHLDHAHPRLVVGAGADLESGERPEHGALARAREADESDLHGSTLASRPTAL